MFRGFQEINVLLNELKKTVAAEQRELSHQRTGDKGQTGAQCSAARLDLPFGHGDSPAVLVFHAHRLKFAAGYLWAVC